ncbi:heme peroxidase [Chlamydoabsidia padenii]|nr:heme peroxidase [Chlamydoabsidia padenii]
MTFSTDEPNHHKLLDLLKTIETELGNEGLVSTLKALAIQTKQDKKSPQVYTSQPTNLAWKVQALIKDLEIKFGITTQRTNSIKEVLSLPISQQNVLMGALVERLLASQGAPVNDRSGTFEATLNVLNTLGSDKKDLINETFRPLFDYYQNTIPKPYSNYVGHSFRTADGSYNSLNFPDVGKAGNNYVRIVNSFAPANETLPPPHLVFQRLLKRPDNQFTPHKSGINMLLFYLGTIVIHDLFYTDHKNPRRNLTSSYLDLSPLYGFNRTDQESVRQMKNGLLKNDQWFDKRLVIQPPGVSTLMVLFNRNHNYAAKHLLNYNENGRFNYGPGELLATKEEQDEELFQTARLINNACFINIIIHDYLRTILGAQQDSPFVFDPLAGRRSPIYGNEVSIEFNIIYRWHGAIGQKDEDWLNALMAVLGPELKDIKGKAHHQQSPASNPPNDNNKSTPGTDQSIFDAMIKPFNEHFSKATKEELEKGLPLAGAHRDTRTGLFDNSDLVKLMRDAYTQVASEIGNGLSTPAALEQIEIAGIKQARALRCCYFNEFREYMDLMPLKTFEDFSEKVEVQNALRDLYGTPDRVELYAGVMVERTLQVGLRLPYTMTRGILSDATNLLRNDRILNQELTPNTLTNWGYEFSQGDPEHFQRVLPKMILLHFGGGNHSDGSVFTPDELKNLFVVPQANNV